MGDLLFNPNGRILRNRFWQGLVILTVLTVLISAASAMINPFLSLFGLLAVFPYICVYGKRLHDVGTTAWWSVGVWLASLLIGFVLGLVIGPFFIDAETIAIQQEIIERMQAGDSEGMMAGLKIVSIRALPLNIISIVITNAVLGAIVGFLATEARTNKHGPVPGASGADVFD